jgi:acyl carrier protein
VDQVDKAEILAQVQDILADVLDLPDLKVTLQTTAEDVEGWDSFNHINIVVAVESKFGIKFHTAEVEELRNVGDLVDLIEKKVKARKPRG